MPRLKWGSQRRATPRHDCASGHPHTSLQPQRNSPVLDESLPDNDDKVAAVLRADDAQSRAARSSDSDEAFKVKYEAAASLSEDADRAGAAFPKADKPAAAMLLPADDSARILKFEDCDKAAVFSSKVKDESPASLPISWLIGRARLDPDDDEPVDDLARSTRGKVKQPAKKRKHLDYRNRTRRKRSSKKTSHSFGRINGRFASASQIVAWAATDEQP
ncbi:uncharacterized protein PSANT_06178 [Moesziomyces antarcticus]|uniref:Uncharacterized protein n=1 Tax=Pseudozyma antarctica TaxID=84753 RepID=A0A5C3FYB9_PSEA2|nr:uncharacterized protein PSANT_06178 [Moesziomyces antarcticus]